MMLPCHTINYCCSNTDLSLDSFYMSSSPRQARNGTAWPTAADDACLLVCEPELRLSLLDATYPYVDTAESVF